MNQPTVLILADDADFARTIVARWQTERTVPAFAVVSSDVWNGTNSAPYEVAIVGEVRPARLTSILKALDSANKPVIYVTAVAPSPSIAETHPRILVLRRYEGWVESVVLLAGECLRRMETLARARRAEQAGAASQQLATLGRYMLEMRHGFNNAMTSMLGNAELLLLNAQAFSPEVRDQIETIHNMSIRLHEIMQRFSSLETELQFAEKKESQHDNRPKTAAASD